ncbi:uncharacterized protein LOC142326885 [Lycorma delicatula]|uniref:uncharacterized protein LOC142326885 n=1 Tax=Lycorma delicatula TaxID=130591 RepID=UPI003F512B31
MDGTYVSCNDVSGNSWVDCSGKIIRQPFSEGERLIVTHAGGERGFFPNVLTLWKAIHSSEDYHNQMNMSNYMKWISETLLPNLPKEPKSILVIDNVSYRNVLTEKTPTSNITKNGMISWLKQKGIGFCFLKLQLYEIIKSNKQRFACYLLDDMSGKEGYNNVLRLPPHHPDLNPIEMIWAEVKQFAIEIRNLILKE